MAAKIPASLKPIAHYIKIANENSNRDPVVYYWPLLCSTKCYFTGSATFSYWVARFITQEFSHLENYALKLFNFADTKEKAGQVDKSVVHAFYTAGHVMDVLSLFGEVGYPSVKYAKWKSTQIFSCLKDGKPYVASSQQSEVIHGDGGQLLPPSRNQPPVATSNYDFGGLPGVPGSTPGMCFVRIKTFKLLDERKPSVEAFNEARKFTKYALSAMDYEDTRAVVDNLRKALGLMERY
ncbi:unnamed protein product [Angiostrongylus costaricensis]|uniref:Cauli_VI domain-containing protein n=1 Tax=Angiostrongylus costaricensis TaxID=334426 RepID=A0A0R3PEJ1_ANGCS|nr:unnamed protein product [Angiostrongylus costaricensis]